MKKQCLTCGQEFFRLGRHSNETWRKAKYCSFTCRVVDRRRSRLTKVCEWCSKEFEKPCNGVSLAKWSTTRFCSKSCTTSWRCTNGGLHYVTGSAPTKPCVGCGKPIEQISNATSCGQAECRIIARSIGFRKTCKALAAMSTPRGSGELIIEPYLIDRGWVTQYVVSVGTHTYRLDFAKPEHKLCVEIDGIGHALSEGKARDKIRTGLLVDDGWMVLRFWNQEVKDNLPCVLNAIWH